ncbi:MAG: hypothetical protein JW720_01945 [Sedimentisphaerales bacterium]|nr:hypothetical protein [Sedimentisphaerales bacterium]
MSLLIFALSLAFGVVVFVRLIGPDAWLIKGLRSDKIGAVVAFCSILVCGVAIFLLLQLSLSVLPTLVKEASAATDNDSAVEYRQGIQVWDVFACILSFCVPILTGYLLSVLYRGIYGAVRKLALR